jgi:hypothetical protein
MPIRPIMASLASFDERAAATRVVSLVFKSSWPSRPSSPNQADFGRVLRLSGSSYCSGVTGEVWNFCAGDSAHPHQGSSSSSKVPSEGSMLQAVSRTL